MGKSLKIHQLLTLLPVVSLLAFAATAEARTLLLWPGSYTMAKPDDGGVRYPDYVTSTLGAQPTYYHVPLNLPIGSIVNRIVYYHQGSTAGAATSVDLWGVEMGKERENLAGRATWDGSNAILACQLLIAGGPITTRAGRKYFFTIQTGAPAVSVRGIKVFYQPPAVP